MTKTVLIEGLIEILKGIASKVEANPSGSHLATDVEGERGSGGDLVAVLNNAAKKTALTSCSVDYTYKVDGTPSVAEPSIISVIGNQLGLVMLDADEVEEHKMYQINLGHPSELDTAEYPAAGHVDVKNGIVTITHVNRILSPVYEDWYDGGNGSFYFDLPTIKPDSEFVCNMGEWVALASYASGKVTTDNQNVELWLAPSGASLDDWKQFLRDNRVEIVYELETPIVYSIEPTEIKTLNCYNNVLVAYQEYVTALNVTYTRDESKAIEALEQGGGGGVTTEVIMGGLDREYGTATSNYIGTFSAWESIDAGKSFTDYDEILIICKGQNSPIYGTRIMIDRTEKSMLQHYDKICKYYYPEGNTLYVKYGLDYTNNKFYLENWNYCCPIALVGVKY